MYYITNIMVRIQVDKRSGVPYYRQIIEQIWAGVASGRLESGVQLPTVRSVAVDQALNPNTVARAYRELEIQGVLQTQQGTGTFIARRPPRPRAENLQRELEQFCHDWLARAAERGFTIEELVQWLERRRTELE